MANDTGDFELEPTKKTWGQGIETRGEDSWTKTVTIEVDALMPSKYELGEQVPNVDHYCDLEAGKQAMIQEATTVLPCISKVRKQYRGGDEKSFTPHEVAIGPYHASSSSSPRIERQKLCCVGFLHSLSERRTAGGLMGLTEKLEPLVRMCYDPDGVSHMTPEHLSTMLLRDGCYLLACMVNYLDIMAAAAAANNTNADKLAHSCSSSSKDVNSASSGGGGDSTVVRDAVFLVENQIPLFVLQRIHERVTGETTTSAFERIAHFVQKLLQEQLYISKKKQLRPAPPQASHLLHLLHEYLQPTMKAENTAAARAISSSQQRTGRWRRAVEYRTHANMRFRRLVFKKDDEWTVLDVRLQGGTLWVPRLRVDGNTWTILRNLMALEEQLPRRPVTAYCLFMSQVAGTAEDVELLVRSGIVEHFLATDEQVAQGFACLCEGVVMDVDNIDRNYLKPVWHQMQGRCDSRVHSFMGWFCQFKNIRIAIALLVALIVVACQLTQTFYAVSYSRRGL